MESSYWNAAASFETGPLSLAAGYFVGTFDFGLMAPVESTFENISLTADYKVAPGLGAYAEIDLITDEPVDGLAPYLNNDATIFILGINASF